MMHELSFDPSVVTSLHGSRRGARSATSRHERRMLVDSSNRAVNSCSSAAYAPGGSAWRVSGSAGPGVPLGGGREVRKGKAIRLEQGYRRLRWWRPPRPRARPNRRRKRQVLRTVMAAMGSRRQVSASSVEEADIVIRVLQESLRKVILRAEEAEAKLVVQDTELGGLAGSHAQVKSTSFRPRHRGHGPSYGCAVERREAIIRSQAALIPVRVNSSQIQSPPTVLPNTVTIQSPQSPSCYVSQAIKGRCLPRQVAVAATVAVSGSSDSGDSDTQSVSGSQSESESDSDTQAASGSSDSESASDSQATTGSQSHSGGDSTASESARSGGGADLDSEFDSDLEPDTDAAVSVADVPTPKLESPPQPKSKQQKRQLRKLDRRQQWEEQQATIEQQRQQTRHRDQQQLEQRTQLRQSPEQRRLSQLSSDGFRPDWAKGVSVCEEQPNSHEDETCMILVLVILLGFVLPYILLLR